MGKNYFIFEQEKEISLSQFTKIIVLFIQKIVTKLSKIWVGIRLWLS
jgi:hypothetical protein